MTIFTIDSENHIAAHGSASEITDKGSEQFTSEKELAQLAADWLGSRLVDIWNRIPGLTPVKRFTKRAVATARIWRAVESLVSGEHTGDVASARRQAARKPTRQQLAHTGRKNTKHAQVVALLQRSGGATLQHLIAYASHCTSLGRCEGFSLTKGLFDNLTPLPFCGGLGPGFS